MKLGDFVFLDSPYIEAHDYHSITTIDILHSKGVKWLMTQADTKQVRTAFKKYKITHYLAYRHGKKDYVKELIIYKTNLL